MTKEYDALVEKLSQDDMMESIKRKGRRKNDKILKWLEEDDKGGIKRDGTGRIMPVKRIYRRLPVETPEGRDAKLEEFE